MKKEVKLTAGVETLFGTLDENLRLLESALHLTAHLKNGSLELEGDAANVERMERIVEDYRQLVQEGITFANGDLLGYLRIVAEDPTASLHALVTHGRHRQFGKKPVVPKSLNQRIY